MATKGTFPVKVESSFRSFSLALKAAACEWFLLFLLLLDGAFSYLLTRFAEYCELPLPCILCSRLEHVLGKYKPNFYRNLLCSDHRSEISSLVLCHNHGKLAEVHELCEECLLSFAKKHSSQETYKILVGEQGLDSMSCSSSTRLCSCCTKPWKSRPNVHKLIQPKPCWSVSKPDIPLPRSPPHRSLNRQEGLKKRKDRFSVSTTPLLLGCTDYDSRSHVGYTEVKINSDSESDFLITDDDDITVPKNVKDDCMSLQGSKLAKKQHDEFLSVGLIHNHTSNLMDLEHKPGKIEMASPELLIPNGDIKHGEAHSQKKSSPDVPGFVSLEDIPLSASAPQVSPILSTDESVGTSHPKKTIAPGFFDLVFHKEVSPSIDLQLPVKRSKENGVDTEKNGDIENTSTTNDWESIDLNSTATLKASETDSVRKDAASPLKSSSSASDVGDIAPSIIDINLTEQPGQRDSNGMRSIEEPTTSKSLLTPQTALSLCIKNQRVNGHADGLHMAETPRWTEVSMPPKSPSMDRSHTAEFLEVSVSEIEGENYINKLRKQVEYDKKCITNLYKELEEERSAAAIAANQAMAMITKLQEEKAALHMEALQYLRMMEEQAEYDVDALERANDSLAEKDKLIQDLEAELDYFRIKYMEDFPEDSDMLGETVGLEEKLTLEMENVDSKE